MKESVIWDYMRMSNQQFKVSNAFLFNHLRSSENRPWLKNLNSFLVCRFSIKTKLLWLFFFFLNTIKVFAFKEVRNNWNQSETYFKKWVFEVQVWQQKLCTNIKVWDSLKTLVFGYCVRVSLSVWKTKEAAALPHKEN